MKHRISRNRKKKSYPSQTSATNHRAIEQKNKQRVFRVNFVYGIISMACVGLILRLSYLQITKSAQFKSEAITSTVSTIPVLPARGRIYDAGGTLLAYDKPQESLYYTQIQGVNTTYAQIVKLANQLGPALNIPARQIVHTIWSDINSTNDYATISLLPPGQYLNNQELAFIGQNAQTLPGISVQVNGQRVYPYGDFAGHELGYVGPITQSQLNTYVNQGIGNYKYTENQIVGQAGLEQVYENYLRGKVGLEVQDISTIGNIVNSNSYYPKPVAGDNIQLTINGRLQAVAQEQLQQTVTAYEATNHTTIPAAAAVVMNVHTGGILAMASYPFIDPNWFTTNTTYKHANYLNTPGVQVNNVIQDPAYPGSTVKPANMMTGLEAGVLTPNFQFYDAPGPLYIGTRAQMEDASYGWVNDVKAIAVSDDKFFYNLGLMLGKWVGSSGTSGGAPIDGFANIQTWRDTYFIKGIMKLVEGELRFGLGRITGIDLPGEQPGQFYIENSQGIQVPLNVPKVEKSLKKTGQYVNQGSPFDLAMMAFGQGQRVTPIQLVQYISTIANGGKRLQPHLLDKVLPPGMYSNLKGVNVKPIYTFKPKVQANLHLNPTYLNIVHQGMYDVCNTPLGTGYYSFYNAPYKAAGKTGTATVYLNGIKTDDSVFEGFAPFNKPQIAVVVMIQGAGYGADYAAPITRTLMDTYFNEEHASFMPKSGWTTSSIPKSWFTSSAYTVPEHSH